MSVRCTSCDEKFGMEAVGRLFVSRHCKAAIHMRPKQSRNVIPAKAGIQKRGSPIKTFGDDTSCQIASPDQPSGTERPSGRPPLNQSAPPFGLLAMTMLCFIFISPMLARAEEIPDRVDAQVISVDEKSRILKVDFEHPATFERSQLEFQVAENAGFKDFKKLKDLKEGDLVSIDYLDYRTILKAIYIIKMPTEKVYFTHKEIAGAFLKIKSNQDENEEKQN